MRTNPNCKSELYILNLIDTPGHVDFPTKLFVPYTLVEVAVARLPRGAG